MYFKITEFNDGSIIVLESNFPFRPRVQLTFVEVMPPPPIADCICSTATTTEKLNSKLEIKLYFQRESILFQVCVKNCEVKKCLNFLMVYKQYTFGTILKAIFDFQLRDSLQNLQTILTESTTCPNRIFFELSD